MGVQTQLLTCGKEKGFIKKSRIPSRFENSFEVELVYLLLGYKG